MRSAIVAGTGLIGSSGASPGRKGKAVTWPTRAAAMPTSPGRLLQVTRGLCRDRRVNDPFTRAGYLDQPRATTDCQPIVSRTRRPESMYAPTRREVEPITNRTAGMALNPGSLTDRTFDNPTRFDIRAPDAGAMALDWSCVTLAYSDKRDWRAALSNRIDSPTVAPTRQGVTSRINSELAVRRDRRCTK